jgi:hypothetical protein
VGVVQEVRVNVVAVAVLAVQNKPHRLLLLLVLR